MARSFSGISQSITCSTGALSATVAGGITVMTILKLGSTSGGIFQLGTTTSTGKIDFQVFSGDFYFETDDTNASTVLSAATADNWTLVGATKATGSVVPRGHKYVYDTNTVTHQNGPTAVPNASGSAGAGGVVQIGAWETSDYFVGDIALVAVWLRVLADAEIENLAFSLQAWYASAPDAGWLLDQSLTTQNVMDFTGGGANQTALGGTSVSTNALPVFAYGFDVPVLSSSAAAGGPATFSRTASDTANATDVATRTLVTARITADTAAATDAATRLSTRARTTSETAAATDAATRAAAALARTTGDTANATDAATRLSTRARTTSETAAATDVAVGQFGIARTATNTAAATDTAVRGSETFTRTTSDTAAATDAVTRSSTRARTTADTAAATDVATRALVDVRATTEAAAATDTAVRAALTCSRTTSDTASATDAAMGVTGGGTSRTATDTAAATDVATRAPYTRTRTTADTANSTDAATRLSTRARTTGETAAATDSAIKTFIRLPFRTTSSTAVATDSAVRPAQTFIRLSTDIASAIDVAVNNLVPLVTGIALYSVDSVTSSAGADGGAAMAGTADTNTSAGGLGGG